MKNFHIVKVRYISSTDTKGSRVKLNSERFPGDSVTISYDYKYNSALDIAVAWLTMNGHKVVGQGESQKMAGYVVLDAFQGSFKQLSNKEQ